MEFEIPGKVLKLDPLAINDGKIKEEVSSQDSSIKTEDNLKLFQCDVCQKTFQDEKLYLKHYERYCQPRKEGNFQECEICGKQYTNQSDLNVHVRTVHEGKKVEKIFNCNFCNIKFTNWTQFKNHNEEVHGIQKSKEKRCKCDVCGTYFVSNSELKMHINNVHLKMKNHGCPLCPTKFGRKSDIKRHMNSVHYKKKPNQCNICDEGFSRPDMLGDHLRSVHEENTHKCDLCEKEFSSIFGLKAHQSSIHKESKKSENMKNEPKVENIEIVKIAENQILSLNEAKNSSKKQHNLTNVENVNDSKPQKSLLHATCNKKCKYCDKNFTNFHEFFSHVKINFDLQANYECELCGKKFEHMKCVFQDHQNEKKCIKKDLDCKFCGESFTKDEDLKIHIKNNFQKDTKFSCNICQETFKEMKCILVKHENEKKCVKKETVPKKCFICKFCGDKFSQNEVLKIHIENNFQKDAIFSCNFCQETFHEMKCVLIKHEKIDHETEVTFEFPATDLISSQQPQNCQIQKQIPTEDI